MQRKIIAIVLSILIVSGIATTVNPVAAFGAVRFVAAGDTRGNDNGVNTVILAEIVQATIDEGADFIIVAGDLVNGSSDSAELESQLTTWRTVMKPLYDAGIGVYPCRGNHDTGSKAAWDNVFSGIYELPGNGPAGEKNITYALTHDSIFIVVLDQYLDRSRVNQAWLDDGDGDPDNDLHQIIAGHGGAPPYDDGSYDGDNGSWTPLRIDHQNEYGYVLVVVDGLSVTVTNNLETISEPTSNNSDGGGALPMP